MKQRNTAGESGYILITVIVAAVLMSALAAVAAQMLITNLKATRYDERSTQALDVADAGINYYLWHLSHDPSDYTDGNGAVATPAPYGPYVHDYFDVDGNKLGTYSLTITPPTTGSTITTVRSVGTVPGLPGTRTILAQLGQPSFSNFIFLANTELNFSATSTTTGPVHSNVGVQFNGQNNGPVTAARSTYTSNVDGQVHNGVWGSGGPQSQWQFPVAPVDFTKVTLDFSSLRTKSQQTGGVYLNGSGGQGFRLILKSNNTIDVYRVNSESTSGLNTTLLYNMAAPTNGVLYSTEELWVSGTGFPGRITIAAARLPDSASTRRSINIVDNLTYAARDGQSAIGLVAQQDVFVPPYAPADLEADAALLAQYGSVGADTSNAINKSSFTLFGAIAQNLNNYGFKTTACVTSTAPPNCKGYPTTNYGFDSHLIYAPPPSFPTTGNYSVLNWREQLFNP